MTEATTGLSIPGIDIAVELRFDTRPSVDVIKRRKTLDSFFSFQCEFVSALSFYAKRLNQDPLGEFEQTGYESHIVLIPDYRYGIAYRLDVKEFVQDYLSAKAKSFEGRALTLKLFVKAMQSFKTRTEEAYYDCFVQMEKQKHFEHQPYDSSTDAALNDVAHELVFTAWNQLSSYYEDDVVLYQGPSSKVVKQGSFYKAVRHVPAGTPFSLANFKPLILEV